MTIEEAVKAARNNTPVIYDSPSVGPLLYARIGCIRKSYPMRKDAADGRAAEEYSLELLPMNGARSLMVAPPERVREAKPEELSDIKYYKE